jgi:hypothetical protein
LATQAGRWRELGGALMAALGDAVVETYTGNEEGEVSGELRLAAQDLWWHDELT